ncbi:unnamed protein product [Prorocentrum cordatum]|uniref:VTT domain-containing protein n=1 Tax=Prorocentrum cordatum TaxID=2364126 RepID=A0ABN9V9Z7_9DINO|nr:unnamed protein product [Polarella glacialis]
MMCRTSFLAEAVLVFVLSAQAAAWSKDKWVEAFGSKTGFSKAYPAWLQGVSTEGDGYCNVAADYGCVVGVGEGICYILVNPGDYAVPLSSTDSGYKVQFSGSARFGLELRKKDRGTAQNLKFDQNITGRKETVVQVARDDMELARPFGQDFAAIGPDCGARWRRRPALFAPPLRREAPLADGGAPAPGRRLPWRPRSLSSDQPQEALDAKSPSKAPAARGEAAEPAPPASAPGRAGGGYFTGDDPAPEEEPFPARRLALLAFGCLALLATGHATGAVEKLDAEHIGSMVRGAGVFGCLVVAAVMSLGELVHVPAGDGWVVYGACIMIYGKAVGFLVGWFAAITSVTFSFFVVRAVGGKSFSQIKSKRIRAVLAQLDKRPFTVVLMLRMVLFAAPLLNYALALSGVSFKDYFLGSAIGIIPPMAIIAVTLDQFMLVRQLMASEGAPASAGQRLGLRGRPPGNLVAFGNMTAGGAARRSSAANGGSSDGAANAESSSAAAFVAAALTNSTPAPALSERLRQQTPEASEAASWLASAPGAGAPPAILAAALLGGGAGHGASDATARLAAALVNASSAG